MCAIYIVLCKMSDRQLMMMFLIFMAANQNAKFGGAELLASKVSQSPQAVFTPMFCSVLVGIVLVFFFTNDKNLKVRLLEAFESTSQDDEAERLKAIVEATINRKLRRIQGPPPAKGKASEAEAAVAGFDDDISDEFDDDPNLGWNDIPGYTFVEPSKMETMKRKQGYCKPHGSKCPPCPMFADTWPVGLMTNQRVLYDDWRQWKNKHRADYD